MFLKLPLLVAALLLSLSALAAGNQYILSVKGLACPFCAFGIEKRLNKVEGVSEVRVDVADSVVRVVMREGETLTEEKARQAVSEAGFTLGAFSRSEDQIGGQDDD